MSSLGSLAAAAAIVALSFAPVAEADCALPPPLEEALGTAPVAFVGTVTGLGDGGRAATFRVEDVWKGNVGAAVMVRGGRSWNPTSVDRFYEAGVRFLVMPYDAAGDVLHEHAGSSTQAYTSDLNRFRPATASPPEATLTPAGQAGSLGGSKSGWSWAALLLVGAGAGLATFAGWIVARRGRTSSPP